MSHRGVLRRRRLAGTGAAIVIAGGMGMSWGSFTVAHAAGHSTGQVTFLGDSIPSGGLAGSAGGASDATAPSIAEHALSKLTTSLSAPSPEGTSVSSSAGGASGFNGLSHLDQRLAGTGKYVNTQFSLEPPDQGLCVGSGFVLESVNDAFAVYSPSGTSLTGPVNISQFYMRSPAINRTTGVRGDFLSDPKCYYDTATGRWFQTILEIDAPGAFGNATDRTHVLVAVSKTSNPTGAWRLFSLDTSNDGVGGTPLHTGCPCLPDQPLIGANRDGFFISTNEFQNPSPNNFNGAQIYAFSKKALEKASGTPSFVHLDTGTIPTGDAGLPFWGSIQPATSPTTGSQGKNVEFLLSTAPMDSQQNNAPLDNRIVVWALIGTESLKSSSPDVELVHHVLHSEVYGPGVNLTAGGSFFATQKFGPTTLRQPTDPFETLNANDSRMNQVVYADGHLFGGVNTVVASEGAPNRVGIAFFVIEPESGDGGVGASIETQGYVAAKGQNVLFPSIGVTSNGVGAMAFSVTGPDFFPSAGFVRFDEDGAHGPIHISGAGALPEDGFSGYPSFGRSNPARWGDYSAAVATPGGQIWMGAEYIPGGARTVNANWGTFISHVSANS